MNVFKWYLQTCLRLSCQNKTDKPRTVGNVVIKPGEWVYFGRDDAPAGY
jgi:hypothetical protein